MDITASRRAELIIRLIQTETLVRQRAFRTLAQRVTDPQDPVRSLSEGLQTESVHGILTPLPVYLDALTEAGVGGQVQWPVVASYLLRADLVDAQSA